jgi:hypothetical protein
MSKTKCSCIAFFKCAQKPPQSQEQDDTPARIRRNEVHPQQDERVSRRQLRHINEVPNNGGNERSNREAL